MIEELEHPYIDCGRGYMLDMGMVIEKINEIIRYLNEKEERNDWNHNLPGTPASHRRMP